MWGIMDERVFIFVVILSTAIAIMFLLHFVLCWLISRKARKDSERDMLNSITEEEYVPIELNIVHDSFTSINHSSN